MKDYNNLSDIDGETLVKTARKIVTEFLKNKKILELDEKFQKDFSFNSGVFVTLNDARGLRGCIGYPLSDRKLFSALESAAISAATEDPRFLPVETNELDSITFEVTVLTPPKKINVSDPQEYMTQIKVGRDGLIVKDAYQTGLLLPQVPVEYNWSTQEFLEHTCEKAGLPKDCWTEPETEVLRFEGIIFKEKEPNGKVIREEL